MKVLTRIIVAVVLVVSVSAIVAANFARPREMFSFKWKLNKEAPLEVTLEPVKRARIVHTIEAPGEVEADVEVEISAKVMGRIIALPLREGQLVKKGDTLVKLDSVEYESAVRSAEAQIQRLKASIALQEADSEKSERDVDRSRSLLKSRAVGATELADLVTMQLKDRARMLMSKAELTAAEAQLTKARNDYADTVIKSPIKGIVSQRIAEEGEMVVIGTMNNQGTVIMTVSDPNTRIIKARVDETDVPLVKPGQKVTIHLQHNEEQTWSGTVLRITPKGTKGGSKKSPVSKSLSASENEVAMFETIISIDNPSDAVRLGMTANVDIQVDERVNALTVPTPAVLHRRNKDLPQRIIAELESKLQVANLDATAKRYQQIVFVEEDGHAVCRLVKTGISDAQRVEILSGLKDGETVITGPYRMFDQIKDTKAVKLMEEKVEEALPSLESKSRGNR